MVKSISCLDRLYQIGEKESYKKSVEFYCPTVYKIKD